MSLINKVKAQYYRLPGWVLRMGGTLYYQIPQKLRYGKVFADTMSKLEKAQYRTVEEIGRQVDEDFVNTVKHAYNQVPFYKNLYDAYGVDITSICGVKDITRLPMIDKQTVKEHSEQMLADDADKSSLLCLSTSGSTGTPLKIYQPDCITMTEWAYTLHIWSRAGYVPDASRLVLRSKKLHPAHGDKPYFYDYLRRELSFDILDFGDEAMAQYVEAIETYKPEFIHGYMSAIIMMARYFDRYPEKCSHRFKAILATSENIDDGQRLYVERVFGARVFSFYGHTERLVIAGECENSSEYHVEPLYGYCEIVDDQGMPTAEGEIVATGFMNPAMPLIRYKTGDIAKWSRKTNCDCGRSYQRIERINGRRQDILIDQCGNQLAETVFDFYGGVFDKIIRYKLIQRKPGTVLMKVQVEDSFTEADKEMVRELAEGQCKGRIRFELQVVEQIPVPANGKIRKVEQHLDV